ncbi:MAG: hypothetical protein AAF441_23780 [Pseudomonadota bacterium]
MWHPSVLETPTQGGANGTAPKKTSTFTHEITLRDKDGNVLTNREVKVSTTTRSVLLINELSYHTGPSQPAAVVSDDFGRVTVALEAHGLSAPAIHVEAVGTDLKKSFTADGRVQLRLSGQDSDFPVDGASLKKNGLWPKQMSDKNADPDAAADQIRKLGRAALQMSHPELVEPAPSSAGAAALSLGDITGALSGLPHDITKGAHRLKDGAEDVAGDIIHKAKALAKDVKDIALKVEGGLVTLVIDGTEMVLKAASQVLNAVEAIFSKIASFMKKVINVITTLIKWLRYLLEFKDIVKTKDVFKHVLTSSLAFIGNTLTDDGPAFITAEFGKIKKEITGYIDEIEAKLEAGTTLASMGTPPENGPHFIGSGTSALNGGRLKSSFSVGAVQSNFVQKKASGKLKHIGSDLHKHARGGSGSSGDLAQRLVQILNNSFDLEAFQSSFSKMLGWAGQVKDPTSFLDVAILEILEATKDLLLLALDLIEAILEVLLLLAGEAITAFRKFITATIDIPVISWLYRQIVGDDLSIADVLCLLVAAPATIFQKIVDGGKAPFTSAQVSAATGPDSVWSQAASRSTERQKKYRTDPSSVENYTTESVLKGYERMKAPVTGRVLAANGSGGNQGNDDTPQPARLSLPSRISRSILLGTVWLTLVPFEIAADAFAVDDEETMLGWATLPTSAIGILAWGMSIAWDSWSWIALGDSNSTISFLGIIPDIIGLALPILPLLFIELPGMSDTLAGSEFIAEETFLPWATCGTAVLGVAAAITIGTLQLVRFFKDRHSKDDEGDDKDTRPPSIPITGVAGSILPMVSNLAKPLRLTSDGGATAKLAGFSLLFIFDALNFGTAAAKGIYNWDYRT